MILYLNNNNYYNLKEENSMLDLTNLIDKNDPISPITELPENDRRGRKQKFTKEESWAIRRLYKDDDSITQHYLAKSLGSSIFTINQVLRGLGAYASF